MTPAPPLWLVAAPPVAAFAMQLLMGVRSRVRSRAPDDGGAVDPWPRRIGVAAVVLASAATLGHAIRLARSPGVPREFVELTTGGARFGALDAGFGFVFDRLSGTACGLACVVALAVAALLAARRPVHRSWQAWAWLELALAGGLVSFLADGLATTLLGWGLTAGASAWLAGWTDPRGGVVRGTRSALAIVALLVGGALVFWGFSGHWEADEYVADGPASPPAHLDSPGSRGVVDQAAPNPSWSFGPIADDRFRDPRGPGGGDLRAFAVAAFLAAAAVMSASTPPASASAAPSAARSSPPDRLPLPALDCGATTGMVGPFLLMRLASTLPAFPGESSMIEATGVMLLLFAARRALSVTRSPANPTAGASRWVALAGGLPGGLTLVALGADGIRGASLVFVSAGLVAALLVGTAAVTTGSRDGAAARGSIERAIFGHGPEAGGTLLMAFERSVLDAIAGAFGVVVHALGWAVARFDRWLVVLLACAASSAALGWFAAPAAAAPTATVQAHGRIRLVLAGGEEGPLVLAPAPRDAQAQSVWVGGLRIVNIGPEPLSVSRIAIRGDQDDVRSPRRLSVRFTDGPPTSATLAPGASKDLVVSFEPENPRIAQAFGHVVVTSSDETEGEVAMGFRAQLPTGLGWIGEHALSLLVAWPLVVALVAAGMRAAGRRDDPLVRKAAVGASIAEVVLALWVYRRFVPNLGRADGNDGFQLVERFVWVRSLGAEWYVGVDGTSVGLVLLAASVGLVAVLVAGDARRTDGFYAGLALLSSGVLGVFVSLDLILLFTAWATVLVALVFLVSGWGGARADRAAARLGTTGAIGSVALLVAIAALYGASSRTFLVDGTPLLHTMAIPELARTSFSMKPSVLGVPFVDAVWVLLFVAAAAAAPLVPFHGWLPDVLEEAPAAVGMIAGGVVVALGPFLLLRVGLAALPEGARWGGSVLAALGAIGATWGSLGAMAQRDLRRFVAYTIIANAGLCLYALAGLTPQGIAGASVTLWSHGVAVILLLAVANAFERRLRTCDARRIQGLVRDAPVLAALLVSGLGLSVGVPGLAGAWAMVLALVGGFAQHPFVGLWLAAALVVGAAAHARIGRLLLFDAVDPAWRRSRPLDRFGGQLPDATSIEMAALVPLAAVALGLGLWPSAILTPMEAAARDASTAVEAPIP